MPKMIVTANRLSFCGEHVPVPTSFLKGSIIETTDDEALGLVEDGNADFAPESSVPSAGTPIEIDPVEKEIQSKNFAAAKGAIKAPEGAEGIKTPGVGIAAGRAGMTGIPSGAIVEPIGSSEI